MKRVKVYKLAREVEGKFYSWDVWYGKTPLCLEYATGKTVKATVGGIFVYDSLERARARLETLFPLYSDPYFQGCIFRCSASVEDEVKIPEQVFAFPLLQSMKLIRALWDGSFPNEMQRLRLPYSTRHYLVPAETGALAFKKIRVGKRINNEKR